MKVSTLTAAVCIAAVTTIGLAAPASATGGHLPVSISKKVLAGGMLSPLSLDVNASGTAYLSQNFPGLLTKVPAGGTQSNIVNGNGDEISAVSTRGDTVYYAQLDGDHTRAKLMSVTKGKAPVTVADLWAHENTKNPDKVNTYGFVGLPASCAAKFPAEMPASYTGIVDTHPYASLATKDGVYVADAGMNAILKVGYNGRVSTVAVLPPTAPVVATAAIVEQFGFPACAAGYKYRFEPVPTDVEVGPGGWLYVTSLPGGPEDASLGARGSVVKVNPWSGKVVPFASGLVGATGLAVSPKTGVVFVAEMFGGAQGTGQVSVVLPWGKRAVTAFPVSSPAAIELVGTSIYLTMDAFVLGETGPQPIGKLVKVSLTGKSLKQYLG